MYAELLLLQDGVLDLLMLLIAGRLWSRPWRWSRGVGAAGMGAAWSLSTAFVPALRMLAIPVLALMTFICWPKLRPQVRIGMAVTLLALAMVAAGAAQLTHGGVTLAAAGGCLLAALAVLRPPARGGHIVMVSPDGPRSLMVDTGLVAVEPLSGKPVILLDRIPDVPGRYVVLQGIGGSVPVKAVPMTAVFQHGRQQTTVDCYAAAMPMSTLRADGLIGSWIEDYLKEDHHATV